MGAEIHFQALPELSLYVHLPWCIRKCPYCDFNSHERAQPIAETAYIDALINDVEQSLPLVWGQAPDPASPRPRAHATSARLTFRVGPG